MSAAAELTTIERLNGLVDLGWMTVLRPIELSVWLAYHRAAGPAEEHSPGRDIAFPSLDTVCNQVGHAKPAHVRQARANLEKYGLLVLIQPGKSRTGGNAVYRVCMVPPPEPEPVPDRNGNNATDEERIAAPEHQPKDSNPFQNGTGSDSDSVPIRSAMRSRSERVALQNGTGCAPNRNGMSGCNKEAQLHSQKHSQRAPSASAAEDPPIPAELDTPAFRGAWAAWARDRQARRKKLTGDAKRRQLAELASYGPDHAVATIDQSIKQGWTGLFPGSTPRNAHRRASPQPQAVGAKPFYGRPD